MKINISDNRSVTNSRMFLYKTNNRFFELTSNGIVITWSTRLVSKEI